MKKDLIITILFALISLSFLLLTEIEISKETYVSEEGSIELHWCIIENCTDIIVNELEHSEDINCAFYTLKHKSLIDILIQKNVALVLHEKTSTELDSISTIRQIEFPKLWGLMHNKFCTYTKKGDKKIITGSYNPSGTETKHDTLIIIQSDSLHSEYLREYNEMFTGTFAGGKKTSVKEVELIVSEKDNKHYFKVEPAFCPEDNCEYKIIEEIKKAGENITILAYTFTSEPIANELIKAKKRGVLIRIITDRGARTTQSSKISWMEENNISVEVVPSVLMHQKTIIIDNTLITGSMNYGKSANTRNDENILIIRDSDRILVSQFHEYIEII